MIIVIDLFGDDEEQAIDNEIPAEEQKFRPMLPEPQLIEIEITTNH